MADTTALKNRIRAAIKANDNQEITGPVLQQALLDIVDELNGATETEASQRQNSDNTLQQSINTERQARIDADTTLGGHIDRLQTTVNNINTKLAEGYIYAGIAIPSTNPGTLSGKVFYIAIAAGTYTNFSNQVLTQGINILSYNGSVWSNQQLIGIDDEPTAKSSNLVKSNGVAANLYKNAYSFTLEGNGDTVVQLVDALTNLTVGKKYIFYASKWNVSNITSGSTVIQFFYYSGVNQVVLRYKKEELPDLIKFEFIAQTTKYSIQIRANSGTTAQFFCREWDEIIDGVQTEINTGFENRILAIETSSIEGGQDTDNDVFNSFCLELYDPTNFIRESGVIAIRCTSHENGRQIFFEQSNGQHFGLTIPSDDAEVQNGVYVSDNRLLYLYLRGWKNMAYTLTNFSGTVSDLSKHPYIKDYLEEISQEERLSKKSTTFEGNGDTNVRKLLTDKLIIGNFYRVVSSIKNWQYSGSEANKCQIFHDSNNVFGQCKTNGDGEFIDTVFIATSNKLYADFRADIGVSVEFSVIGAFNDYLYDDGIKLQTRQIFPTDNSVINSLIEELYLPDYNGNQILVHTGFSSDGRFQLFIEDSSENRLIGITFTNEKPCGVYKYGNNYICIRDFVQIHKKISGQLNVSVTDFKKCPKIATIVIDKSTIKIQNIVLVGQGTTIVSTSITNLIIGKKYTLFVPAWNTDGIEDSGYVLQLYYSANSTGSTTIVVAQYQKRTLHEGSYIKVDFVAEYSTCYINFRGANNVSVTLQLKEYDLQEDYTLSKQILQNETYHIEGDGSTVVQKYHIIKGLVVGEKYVFYAEKWAMTEVDSNSNVLQLFYNDGTNHVIYQVTKSVCPDIIKVEFVAEYNQYSINFRGDSNLVVDFQVKKFDAESEYELEILETNNPNYWKGKSIAWYGTSIPAGGYPQRIANILGATVYNYAKGSSSTVKGNSYLTYDRNLGHTIAEKVAMVKDTWTIDDTNQTFVNGPRTMGFRDYPEYTTYAQVVHARLSIITASYEVVILVRTLLSDESERTSFLQSALGDLYDYMMANHASSFAYHDIDLWVLDHGHNDNCGTDPSQIDMSQVNLTSFVGAMNYYIGLISQYKPHARICMVSDYDNFDEYTKKYTLETQQTIADRWHLPIIRIDKYLPFNINTKVRTRGYWDANAVWHDTGFVWGTLNGNMIGNGHFPNYIIQKFYESGRPPRTIEELTALLNPSQDAAGNWWYDLEPRYIWLFDGLHPHSVAGGYALKMYAEPLAELLKNIGTNGY